MNPTEVLERHRHLVVVNSENITQELGISLRDAPRDVKERCAVTDGHAGNFMLYRHPTKHLDKVLEVVVSRKGDSISSVYISNGDMLEDAGSLARARIALIRAVAARIGLPPESVGIDDAARGRTLSLLELSTGQLIDMLAEREGKTFASADAVAGGALG